MSVISHITPTALILIGLIVLHEGSAYGYTLYNDTFPSTVTFYDQSYTVLVPASYTADPQKRFPVLYLLHPAYNTEAYWLGLREPGTQFLIDAMHFIVVVPYDGNGLSWWLNSPKVATNQYSTFLATEFKHRIDSLYRTLPDKGNTGIAGQSMGGFGAIHNRIEHPDVYGSVLMLKSAIDMTLPTNPRWPSVLGLNILLGEADSDKVNFSKVNPIVNAARLVGPKFPLRIYNGILDSAFLFDNRKFHLKLDSLGVSHEYIELPEGHSGCNMTQMQEILRFFDTSFVYGGSAAIAPRRSIMHMSAIPGGRPPSADPVDLSGKRVKGDRVQGTIVKRGKVRIGVR